MDLDAGEISINKAGSYTPEKGLFIKNIKNTGSVRSVSLPGNVVDMLRQHRKDQAMDRLKLGELWQGSDLVFTQWNGLQMHTSTPRQWMSRFLVKYNLGINLDEDLSIEEKAALILPVIPFHGLRHASATLLIAGHTDIRTVSGRLGHSRTSTTTDVYSHFLKTSDKNAAQTL